jgi:pyruvate dehydrogenase E1 component alpha subunit
MNGLPAQVTRERGLQLLREMLRIRQFEDRCAELYGAGEIRGFLHLYDGEEAIAVGVMQVLGSGDAVVSTYREHGHALARGVAMKPLMAELFGRQSGCSGGRGGSMHIFDAATRFYGGNAIVAGGLPLAAGLALAEKMRGSRNLAACFFGEGAAAEGEFHESMNLAALWKLPVLFLCENTLYAMGTALARSESQTDIRAKAAAYAVRAEAVDGMDVFAVEAAVRSAAEHARAGRGPVLLEFRTYRLRAHSMFDAQLYRDKAEVDEWRRRGPLSSLTTRLKAAGLMTEDDFQRLLSEADDEVQRAVQFATAAPWEPVQELARHVCAERVPS